MDNQNPKILKLQIDRACFLDILSGEQTVEHRFVYPHNAKRYVIQEDVEDEDGKTVLKVTPINYDVLHLRNGRRMDAPLLTVEILDAEFVVLTDEKGNNLTYDAAGKILACQVWYTLGKILHTENLEQLGDVKIKGN